MIEFFNHYGRDLLTVAILAIVIIASVAWSQRKCDRLGGCDGLR